MTEALQPGTWLGMIGGGVAARLFALAAQALGYRVAVLDPDPRSPAASAADRHLTARCGDDSACAELASLCAAVATESDQVPLRVLESLSSHRRVMPCARFAAATRDRAGWPDLLRGCEIAVAPAADGDADPGREICAIAARDAGGDIACFPIVEVVRSGADVALVIEPARVAHDVADRARGVARWLAGRIGEPGLVTVGFRLLPKNTLVVSAITPWAQECGHYTVDACATSQYAQQVRALAGQPLGSAEPRGPAVVVNLPGEAWRRGEPDWNAVLGRTNATLHLYGQAEARPGRSMGHCTVRAGHIETALDAARTIRRELGL
jgi:5-(carboxyamino)imidazole ribonucleotide synthase